MACPSESTRVSFTGNAQADPDKVHRTILLLGKTGNGKSTVGNVIVGTHRKSPPTEVFSEGEFGSSETKETHEYIAEIGGRKYRIVDTIGLCDTDMLEKDVLLQLSRTCHYLRGGISQILFVSSGRFTKEEQEAYNVLRQVLFDANMGRFVTIVRTRSSFFENQEKCDADIEKTKSTCTITRSIYENVNRIIHVSNPNEYESPTDWKSLRQKSCTRLCARLEMCGELYKPPKMEMINHNIDEYIEKVHMQERKIMKLLKDVGRNEAEIAFLRKQLEESKSSAAGKFLSVVVQLLPAAISAFCNSGTAGALASAIRRKLLNEQG